MKVSGAEQGGPCQPFYSLILDLQHVSSKMRGVSEKKRGRERETDEEWKKTKEERQECGCEGGLQQNAQTTNKKEEMHIQGECVNM